MGAVAYESFSIQSLSHSSNGVSQRWSLLELDAYESGRKENFNCITFLDCRVHIFSDKPFSK